jgi:hypothetical protein
MRCPRSLHWPTYPSFRGPDRPLSLRDRVEASIAACQPARQCRERDGICNTGRPECVKQGSIIELMAVGPGASSGCISGVQSHGAKSLVRGEHQARRARERDLMAIRAVSHLVDSSSTFSGFSEPRLFEEQARNFVPLGTIFWTNMPYFRTRGDAVAFALRVMRPRSNSHPLRPLSERHLDPRVVRPPQAFQSITGLIVFGILCALCWLAFRHDLRAQTVKAFLEPAPLVRAILPGASGTTVPNGSQVGCAGVVTLDGHVLTPSLGPPATVPPDSCAVSPNGSIL